MSEDGLEEFELDAFKLPHHGSKANISAECLGLVRCKQYLFSTNGQIFNHPDMEGVARVIRHGGKKPILNFNYRSDETGIWADENLVQKHKYTARYPDKDTEGKDKEGLLIEL
jgi:hypothetical protein